MAKLQNSQTEQQIILEVKKMLFKVLRITYKKKESNMVR